MSTADRDLVAALRAELAAIDPARACDRAAELAGLGTTAVRGDRPALARLVVRLLRDGTGQGGAGEWSFDWDGVADHCRSAYVRGRFLARGSLSLAAGRHHLEFVVDPADAAELGRRLADAGLPAGVRIRRGRGVVTWKSAETIGTFLRWIGAGSALLELESRQVARAVRGDLSRILNAEAANLERSAAASARQLEAIAVLEGDGRLEELPATIRAVALERRSSPEAPLSELADRLEIARARAQRALELLLTLAQEDARPQLRRRAAKRPGRWSGAERPPRSVAGGPSPRPGPMA